MTARARRAEGYGPRTERRGSIEGGAAGLTWDARAVKVRRRRRRRGSQNAHARRAFFPARLINRTRLLASRWF